MKYDVFISYSRKDSVVADKICRIFDKQEPAISYFIDRQGIDGAAEFPEILANAIDESSIVLFLASANSYKSDYTKKEIAYTINKKGGTALFPLMLDNAKLPGSLELQLSNINWRVLGGAYTLEESLVSDIRKKLEDPNIGETFETKKHKKDNKMLLGAICSVLVIFAVSLFLVFKDSKAKKSAIHSSEMAEQLMLSADSLLASVESLKLREIDEDRLIEELSLLDRASAKVKEAQLMRNEYIGTEFLPLFTINPEEKVRKIEATKDSMYATWSYRAQDAFEFYCRVGSKVERQLAIMFADNALLIRPNDSEMNKLKEKISNNQ